VELLSVYESVLQHSGQSAIGAHCLSPIAASLPAVLGILSRFGKIAVLPFYPRVLCPVWKLSSQRGLAMLRWLIGFNRAFFEIVVLLGHSWLRCAEMGWDCPSPALPRVAAGTRLSALGRPVFWLEEIESAATSSPIGPLEPSYAEMLTGRMPSAECRIPLSPAHD